MSSAASTAPPPRAASATRAVPALAWLAVLVGTWVLSRAPEGLNRPLLRLAAGGLFGHPVLDVVAMNLANTNTLTGAVFMAAAWHCWFRGTATERQRVLAGTLAGFVASALARVLQGALPFELRPLHDPQLGVALSPLVDHAALAGWSSFPSDNAALWFALAGTVAIVRPRLGAALLGWAALGCFARFYLGYHYPTDIAGGAALGLLLVAASGHGPARRLAGRLVGAAERRPDAFYGWAFLASFLIATQLDGVRRLLTDLATVAQAGRP